MGLSARQVAQLMDLDPTGFTRIEKGLFSPRQDTARKIFELYNGLVPLGLIYDTTHPSFEDWLTPARKKKLAARGRALLGTYVRPRF